MIRRNKHIPVHSNLTPISHWKMIDYYFDTEPDDIKMVECHRGLGKTQLGMEFSLYCVCEGIEDYILFVGATQDLTNDIVSSASELLGDTTIPSISIKRSVEGLLEVHNKLGGVGYLVAKSTGSKLRGVAKGKLRHRPTLIVLDDIVDDQLIMNPLRIFRANTWITSALLPTLAPGGKTIGSGTPMKDGDPFMTLVKAFGSYKIPLSDTSFPDRFTPDYVIRKKAQYEKLGQMRDWNREYNLVLTDEETQLFNMKKINYIAEHDVPEDLTWSITLDGAFSEKESADYSAFACLGIDKNGMWYVAPYDMKDKPQDVIGKLFELQSKYRTYNIGIEKGSFKLSMEREIELKQREYQQYFSVNELNVNGSKISRIKALEPIVNSGRLTIIDTGESAERLLDQLVLTDSFTCHSKHDDLLDALSQQVQMDLFYSENSRDYTREEYLDSMEVVDTDDDLWN